MNADYDTKCFLAENGKKELKPPENEQKNVSKFQKPYIFYCIMTLSVMLFTLAFAASELFALFFSDGDIGNMVLNKLFGSDASGDKSIEEIMLGQSFVDLSLGNGNKTEVTDNDDTPNITEPVKTPDVTKPSNIETGPQDSNETGTTQTTPKDIYEYTPDKIPSGMSGIIPLDLGLSEYGNSYIHNQSSFTPKLDKLEDVSVSVSPEGIYPSGAPLVLIIHTHGTESYTDEGSFFYDPSKEIARSSDMTENVVYIGQIISDALNKAGIPTLHSNIMHDSEGYSGSYERSAETIKKYLSEYPSIQYVIDIHRDAIVRSTGELVRPVIPTENGGAAQVMCVVGSGGISSEIKNWESNLVFAQRLRELLNVETEGLCRPTCLRDSSYNQQYSTYSILIEMGAAGNTLKEAELSASLVADALANLILG